LSSVDLANLLLNVVNLVLLISVLRIKRETRELLRVVKEWVDLIQSRDASANLQTERVERKVDRLAVTSGQMPDATANKVVERIAEVTGTPSSDALKIPKLPDPGVK
jgi:hypothetical protein